MESSESVDQVAAAEAPAPVADNTKVKRKRSTRNLILRGVSALAALGLVYGCLRWDIVNSSGWAWAGFVTFLSLLCLREFYRLAIDCDIHPFRHLGYVAGPLWILATEWDLSGGAAMHGLKAAWCVVIFLCAGTMLLQLTRKTNDNALNNVSITIFGVIYCCMLPGITVHLRHLGMGPGSWPMHGVEFAVVCVFVSKVSDVGALLTGSRWGKHKLIPRLSPGKTKEGAFGGLMFSILLLQLMTYTEPNMALAGIGRGWLVVLSFLLAAGGLAGDLIESAFKRNSQRKDAGAGVPGFGGMLDLTDSMMIASPVMYFFLIVFGAEYVQ